MESAPLLAGLGAGEFCPESRLGRHGPPYRRYRLQPLVGPDECSGHNNDLGLSPRATALHVPSRPAYQMLKRLIAVKSSLYHLYFAAVLGAVALSISACDDLLAPAPVQQLADQPASPADAWLVVDVVDQCR